MWLQCKHCRWLQHWPSAGARVAGLFLQSRSHLHLSRGVCRGTSLLAAPAACLLPSVNTIPPGRPRFTSCSAVVQICRQRWELRSFPDGSFVGLSFRQLVRRSGWGTMGFPSKYLKEQKYIYIYIFNFSESKVSSFNYEGKSIFISSNANSNKIFFPNTPYD